MRIVGRARLGERLRDVGGGHPAAGVLAAQGVPLLALGMLVLLMPLLAPQASAASAPTVFVPPDEYLGYVDAHGIYTVVGNVKNQNEFAVVPTVTVSVAGGGPDNSHSKTIRHVPLGPHKEIPFKIKFPGLATAPVPAPLLASPEVSFERAPAASAGGEVPIRVLYDETLVVHDDGHVTGRIQNTGDRTVHYPKIYAVVHGHESVLDIAQNVEFIEKIDPGQILAFSMYPDPSVPGDRVSHYSCFAPVDTTVVPVTASKNGGDFDFRYDSGAWYYAAAFDEEGTTMSINGYNSYPIKTYANFEFAPISGSETFSVAANGKPVRSVQSIDEMGLWHVAFDVEPTFQGVVTISGFEEGLPPDPPGSVPDWVRQSAEWWSAGRIQGSEFAEGLAFLVGKGLLAPAPPAGGEAGAGPVSGQERSVPPWTKSPSGWWYEGRISDDEFLRAVQWMISHGVIRV